MKEREYKCCKKRNQDEPAFTLWIKVRRLEVMLGQVDVPGDCPQLQTEHLAAVLELLVGTLRADLTRQFPSQNIRSCRENFILANNNIRPFSPLRSVKLPLPLPPLLDFILSAPLTLPNFRKI